MDDLTLGGYLLAAILFVGGLKLLARPRTAVRGNQLGATGMLVAVVVTLTDDAIITWPWLVAGVIVGTVVGVPLALRVRMTAMPELVALFNGFGGAASVLVAVASFTEVIDLGGDDSQVKGATVMTVLIGSVTFTGSLVAVGKLREALRFGGVPGNRVVLAAAVVASGVLCGGVVADPETDAWLWALVAVGAVIGILGTAPIGGADMPVVIALLNSLSGVAAAAAGFALDNTVLIVAGALVGASGLVLTRIMCAGMNRSLLDVLAGGGGGGGAVADADDVYGGHIRSTDATEVALMLETAGRVVIVPGYGLAVAQAQHAVRDLTAKLTGQGTEVLFGIHPVAGRMPGHMNVLLAEAEVPYEQLLEMDDVNPLLDQTDVAIVLGANDVVNPIARTDPDSAIAGMPIIDVGRARVVIVIKRSLSPGFAGIPNPLFAADNTLMLFGDGREVVQDLNRAIAEI
ncbi:MAG: NAD(P)(+) transhydrogenase (Re/Si-specific) subunit beta [Acidimicrobiales bacterium]